MAYTIAFFGSKPYDEASFNEKNSGYGFELRYYKGHLNLNNVILTQGVDAVCIFVNDTADAEVIRQLAANGVKLLALRCAGYNNVDLKAAAENGITVVRVPAYSPYAVAEYTVALMLSLNRKIPRATWRTRDGNFSLHGLLGFDMYGKTAGIIGTGKIAKKLIAILRGFGMNILAYDLYPDYNFAREHQVVYTTLDELYRSSDIISLHCPLTEQTRYLINDYSISKMKDGVMEEVKKIFKPEFINRIDEILVFHTLTKENIEQIVRIMLNTLNKRTTAQMNLTMEVTEEAVAHLAESGFDKNYGARPVRRAIQTQLEDALADALLDGTIAAGDKIKVDCKDKKIIFSKL